MTSKRIFSLAVIDAFAMRCRVSSKYEGAAPDAALLDRREEVSPSTTDYISDNPSMGGAVGVRLL